MSSGLLSSRVVGKDKVFFVLTMTLSYYCINPSFFLSSVSLKLSYSYFCVCYGDFAVAAILNWNDYKSFFSCRGAFSTYFLRVSILSVF